MAYPDLGIWFVGAFGSVASTTALGLAALQRNLTSLTGLVTATAELASLPLPSFDRFVVGGHDIRAGSMEQSVRELHEQANVLTGDLIEQCRDQLAEWNRNVRPGTVHRCGRAVEALVDRGDVKRSQSPLELVEQIADDILEFRNRNGLDHVVVVNLASTEPPVDTSAVPDHWSELDAELARGTVTLPASCLYALAAIRTHSSYINFTPSAGISLPALRELADREGILYAGQDGKTGETLLKTVLAPMFRHRNLRVLSWVGHNIFGNRDGLVLDDPQHKASKVKTKDRVLGEILGYTPQTLVTIEYIESLADWKTAWDHIHFEGFLGTKMVLQFTWQGCDSLLAAPLVLDLVRLTAFEWQRGGKGLQKHLASFFKNPLGVESRDFFEQWQLLKEYASEVMRSGSASVTELRQECH